MNLKDLYSLEQATSLVDEIPDNIDIIKIGRNEFYKRADINNLLEEYIKNNPRKIFQTRQKIFGVPAYDLDLSEWVDYNTALEVFPLSHQRLIQGKDTYDKLKIIRTKRVYGILFYNLSDIQYYVALNPPTEYHNVSWVEGQKIKYDDDMINQYIIETDPNLLGSWYTPKELAFVLGFPRRYLWNWVGIQQKRAEMPNRRKFSRAYLYYVKDVHEWLDNNEYSLYKYKSVNWRSRWVHLAQYRIRNESFDDWVCLGQVNTLIDYSRVTFHLHRKELNWPSFDYGGIRVYLKKPIKEMLLNRPSEGKITFPFTSHTGIYYETEEEWLQAVKQW